MAKSFVSLIDESQETDIATDTDQEVHVAENVGELHRMAARLETSVQKYPKSGKGLFKSPQERYIAAIPESDATHKGDGRPNSELERWKCGHLAYWESAIAFRRKHAPKGQVPLLRIAKVHCAKDDQTGRGVIVKHRQGNDMNELVLLFPTKRDAEEWSYALWDFLSKLRDVSAG